MKFYSPFGPYILHAEVDENSHKNLLNSVLQLEKERKSGPAESTQRIITGDDRTAAYEDNSISEGQMHQIKPDQVEIGEVIRSFTAEYFKQFEILNPFCDDSGSIIKHKDYTDFETHEPLVKNVWYVVMKPGDFHIIHAHKVAGPGHIGETGYDIYMSGSIYLDVPEDIKPPQGNLNFSLGSHDEHLSNCQWSITPKNGDVCVWPSWLKHFVYPFRSSGERIMISFNSIWKKKAKLRKSEMKIYNVEIS